MSNNNIESLDNLFKCLYESKFNTWLSNKFLKTISKSEGWHVKSSDLDIRLNLVKVNSDFSFIKSNFHIGLIHISNQKQLQSHIISLDFYTCKPELIGFITARPVDEDGDLYLDLSYNFNIFPEFNLVDYFNKLYDQILVIKQDIEFRLGVSLLDSINTYDEESNRGSRNNNNVSTNDEEDEDEDEDDDDDNNPLSSPFDLGRGVK